MPLPLLAAPWVIATVAVAVVGAMGAAAALIRYMLKGKTIAILGGQHVGKTTLLRFMSEGALPEAVRDTVDSAHGRTVTIKVGKSDIKFTIRKDVSGNQGLGLADWKDVFDGADYVWYLFRADLIVQGDRDQIDMVSDHIDVFKSWLGTGTKPKILLIGTWADKSPVYSKNSTHFKSLVRATDTINLGSVKLNNAPVVVGSLENEKDAAKLVNRIRANLK